MDDMLIIVRTRREALRIFEETKNFMAKKGLELNPKSCYGPLSSGFKFLKTEYTLTKTGQVRTKTLRTNISNEIHRLNGMYKKFLKGEIDFEEMIQHGNTWSGFALERASKNQIDHIKEHITDLFLDFHWNDLPSNSQL